MRVIDLVLWTSFKGMSCGRTRIRACMRARERRGARGDARAVLGAVFARARTDGNKENAVLALRFFVGFLVQMVPCAVLCALPFSDCYRGVRSRVYALVACVVVASDVVFTAAAVGPLSRMSEAASGGWQNLLFLISVAALFAIFVRAVDAGLYQKAFVFLVVMCFGYFVAEFGDFIAEIGGFDSDVDDRIYDPEKLAVLLACTVVLFVPMVFAMKSLRRLLAMPVEASRWFFMDVMLLLAVVMLLAFEVSFRYVRPGNSERDIFLVAALAAFAVLFLGVIAHVAHTSAHEARDKAALAAAVVARDREIGKGRSELAQARAHVVELEGALERLERTERLGKAKESGGRSVPLAGAHGERQKADHESDGPVILTTGNKAMSFYASDVMYAESLNRVRTVHLAGGESFKVNMTLAQIFDNLPADRFIYCHRSVVVNLDFVRLMSEETLTLADGTRVPVGRRRVQEVREAFKEHGARRG